MLRAWIYLHLSKPVLLAVLVSPDLTTEALVVPTALKLWCFKAGLTLEVKGGEL
jgi:hypothetical protein